MLTQLSIYTENRKGAMSAITGILAAAGVDINAFVTNDSGEFGTVRMLVSDPARAAGLLTEAGYLLKQTSVLALEISDEVGSLDRLLEAIENANVNIDYLYASYDRASAGPIIVVRSDDLDELEGYLAARGFVSR